MSSEFKIKLRLVIKKYEVAGEVEEDSKDADN